MVPWDFSRRGALLFVVLLFILNVNAFVTHQPQLCCASKFPKNHSAPKYRGDKKGYNCQQKIRLSYRFADNQVKYSSLKASHLASPRCIPGQSARALGCLVSSALFGNWIERFFPDGGILATMVISALFSSLGLAPSAHFLYDMCWSTFSPASLALLLLAMKEPTAASVAESNMNTQQGDSIQSVVGRMATPFCIASLGSVFGCLVSFLLCCWKPCWLLVPSHAAIAASCLVASFIGGSVNFFATAATITAAKQGHEVTVNTIVSSMAAADLVVMAIYFVLISAALQSVRLRSWFEGQGRSFNSSSLSVKDQSLVASNESRIENRSLTLRLLAPIAVSALALLLVHLARQFETALERFIPGTACGFLAATTPLLTRIIPPNLAFWKEMQNTAGSLSSFSFLMLFAAIGVTADLEAALVSGPACLIFSGIALSVHGIITLTGSWLLNNIFGKKILFDDVLITSNAAIGGPATAASFCGRMPNNSRAMTISATVWGVVGYAGGTTIGISLYRFLQSFFY